MLAGTMTDTGGLSPIRFWQNVAVASCIVFARSIRSKDLHWLGLLPLIFVLLSAHCAISEQSVLLTAYNRHSVLFDSDYDAC